MYIIILRLPSDSRYMPVRVIKAIY